MGAIASRYSKQHDDDGSASKSKQRFAVTRHRREFSSRRGNNSGSNSNSRKMPFHRSKNSSLKNDVSHQATLVSGGNGDATMMQGKSKRAPLENISNDEVVDTKEKSSRGKKTAPKAFTNTLKEEEIVAIGDLPPKIEPRQQPVDPPGSHWNHSSSAGLSSLQHVGFSMPMWAPPHLDGGDTNGSRWAMPPFLAPIAATVRQPFSHFVPNGQGYFHYWQQQQQGGNNAMQFGMSIDGVETETMNFTVADTDVTMKEDIVSMETVPAPAAKLAGISDIPSTFAPQECVEKIRAKDKAAQVNVIQTRSMTAKKSHSSKSSKQRVAPIAAHQASSPPSTKDKQGTRASLKSTVGDDVSVETLTVLGKTVHMIDAERKIFVIDLLSPETCDEIRMMADNHTRNAKKDAEVWRTLYTYTKMDLPVVEVKDMVSKYTDTILYDVKKICGIIFGKRREAMRLRPRSWKEPHLLLYQALDDKPHHTGIEMHYDGCDITFSTMLSRQDEYEGGGTYFRCLRKTVLLQQGQVLVHPGELYHKGREITYGVRTLLVCFMDGFDPKILDDSKADEDDPLYEENLLLC